MYFGNLSIFFLLLFISAVAQVETLEVGEGLMAVESDFAAEQAPAVLTIWSPGLFLAEGQPPGVGAQAQLFRFWAKIPTPGGACRRPSEKF